MSSRASELDEREQLHRPLLGLAIVAAVAAALAVALCAEPRGHNRLPAIARYAMTTALPRWHTTEPVNEVVYGSRGFDTFGETFILLGAVVGIGTITRRKEARRGFIGEELLGREEETELPGQVTPGHAKERRETRARQADRQEQVGGGHPSTPDMEPLGKPAPEHADAMTVVVRGAVRIVAPILLVAGVYLAAWGYSPGGGFPAGGVILGVVLLVYVAYGYPKVRRLVRPGLIEPLEMAGALAIIAVEALGLVLKGSFSANWLPLGPAQTLQSGGILQAFSGAELIEVATGLILAIFGLLGMAHDWAPNEQDDES